MITRGASVSVCLPACLSEQLDMDEKKIKEFVFYSQRQGGKTGIPPNQESCCSSLKILKGNAIEDFRLLNDFAT